MDIQEIKRTFQVPAIKKQLNENRAAIEHLNNEILRFEKEKTDVTKNLKSREALMRKAIAVETEIGKTTKKYPNDTLREAEFISRSASNREISNLRDELLLLNETIHHQRILLEIETNRTAELLLDYKLAITMISLLPKEDIGS